MNLPELHVFEAGSGAPVVLLHGVPSPPADLEALAVELPEHHVLVPHLPGCRWRPPRAQGGAPGPPGIFAGRVGHRAADASGTARATHADMSRATLAHQAPLEILRRQREVVWRLGTDETPPEGEVTELDTSTDQPIARTVDAAFALRRPDGSIARVRAVEMQRRIDPGKPVAWLGYVADMTARHGAPVELVVLTSSSKVARWAARVEVGPCLLLQPVVVGPGSLSTIAPIVSDADAAWTALGASLLLAGTPPGPHRPKGRAALAACRALVEAPRSRARDFFLDLLLGLTPDGLRAEIDKLLEDSDMTIEELIMAAGRKLGRKEGREEGREEGRRALLLRLLARRFGDVPEGVIRRLESASETELDRWGEAVLDAPSIDAVFAS